MTHGTHFFRIGKKEVRRLPSNFYSKFHQTNGGNSIKQETYLFKFPSYSSSARSDATLYPSILQDDLQRSS